MPISEGLSIGLATLIILVLTLEKRGSEKEEMFAKARGSRLESDGGEKVSYRCRGA